MAIHSLYRTPPFSRYSWYWMSPWTSLSSAWRAGRAAYRYLAEAVRQLKVGEADGLVTAPVSKEAIHRAGISWVGHTEFLAESFRCRATMMFATGSFRVSLVTTHCPLRELPRRLTRAELLRTLAATHESLREDFGIPRPRIGLASLNPHGGEGGLFGREERRLLLPAVRAFPHPVAGPLPVDSLMQQAARGAFDAVVALYHDQALIPVKLLGWEQAVNVTLGLPFVRTSPVHGTAFDLAGGGKADPRSMLRAIQLAIELAGRRGGGRVHRPARPPAYESVGLGCGKRRLGTGAGSQDGSAAPPGRPASLSASLVRSPRLARGPDTVAARPARRLFTRPRPDPASRVWSAGFRPSGSGHRARSVGRDRLVPHPLPDVSPSFCLLIPRINVQGASWR